MSCLHMDMVQKLELVTYNKNAEYNKIFTTNNNNNNNNNKLFSFYLVVAKINIFQETGPK